MKERPDYSASEMMTITAARLLESGMSCFVGIGLPSLAANLARLTHAPDLVLIYESGPIGAKPPALPLSIGDGNLAETADTVVSTPEMFQYWLQGGHIDVGFLGAAQIDRFGNINTTVIGDYRHPTVRLPGAGGAPEIAGSARRVFLMLKQSARAFVSKLDFITTVGYLDGGDARARLGLVGAGPVVVITDLCVLEPEPPSHEMVVTSIHPGVTREQIVAATGWPIRFAERIRETEPPTSAELLALRDLQARTRAAHGEAS
ncbi:MAG TPA: CoA-transferase subunit beta [Ktedonobacterales bacterium]|nr:CoA-transferase subunit beta [Ktedonobacterales bacterium]